MAYQIQFTTLLPQVILPTNLTILIFCHFSNNRLLALEVVSLEDVYWLEDSKARQVLNKDFPQWSVARQALPINKHRLELLKADLWSEVVKSSNHQDAWTWGT